MKELIYGDRWGEGATWAVDPPGTQYTERYIEKKKEK
jgi:hypothetical protein